MLRRLLPLALLVMLAILGVVFATGREHQFAAAAARLPDQVMGKAQDFRSEVKGRVVLLQDIVDVDAKPADEVPQTLLPGQSPAATPAATEPAPVPVPAPVPAPVSAPAPAPAATQAGDGVDG